MAEIVVTPGLTPVMVPSCATLAILVLPLFQEKTVCLNCAISSSVKFTGRRVAFVLEPSFKVEDMERLMDFFTGVGVLVGVGGALFCTTR